MTIGDAYYYKNKAEETEAKLEKRERQYQEAITTVLYLKEELADYKMQMRRLRKSSFNSFDYDN